MKIKSRLWIESNGAIVLGEGRIELLKAIDKNGSINMACKTLGMSYKKAQRLVHQMNVSAEDEMVRRKTGGAGGGGTIVTEYGKEMIANFEKMKSKVWELTANEEKQFSK